MYISLYTRLLAQQAALRLRKVLRDSQSWVGGRGERGGPGGRTFSWAELSQCLHLSSARQPASGLPQGLAGIGDRLHVPTCLQGGRELSPPVRRWGDCPDSGAPNPPQQSSALWLGSPPASPQQQQAAPRPQACSTEPGQPAARQPGGLAEEIQPLGPREPGTPRVRHRGRSATPRVSARCTACLQ